MKDDDKLKSIVPGALFTFSDAGTLFCVSSFDANAVKQIAAQTMCSCMMIVFRHDTKRLEKLFFYETTPPYETRNKIPLSFYFDENVNELFPSFDFEVKIYWELKICDKLRIISK